MTDVVLKALERDHKRLERIAKSAKAEADACIHAGSELLAIYEELRSLVASKETGRSILDKLESLKVRSDAAKKVVGKSLIALLDKQSKAEAERDQLTEAIGMMKWRNEMRLPANGGD